MIFHSLFVVLCQIFVSYFGLTAHSKISTVDSFQWADLPVCFSIFSHHSSNVTQPLGHASTDSLRQHIHSWCCLSIKCCTCSFSCWRRTILYGQFVSMCFFKSFTIPHSLVQLIFSSGLRCSLCSLEAF